MSEQGSEVTRRAVQEWGERLGWRDGAVACQPKDDRLAVRLGSTGQSVHLAALEKVENLAEMLLVLVFCLA